MPWVSSPLASTPAPWHCPAPGSPCRHPPVQPNHPQPLLALTAVSLSGVLRAPFAAPPQQERAGCQSSDGSGRWGKPTCSVCKAPSRWPMLSCRPPPQMPPHGHQPAIDRCWLHGQGRHSNSAKLLREGLWESCRRAGGPSGCGQEGCWWDTGARPARSTVSTRDGALPWSCRAHAAL